MLDLIYRKAFLLNETIITSKISKMVAPPRLELGSPGPEPRMIDRYTTGLSKYLAPEKALYLFGIGDWLRT
jgi:hypothetical protein